MLALRKENAKVETAPKIGENIEFKHLLKNIQSTKNIQTEIADEDSNEELNHLTTVPVVI